MSSFTPFLVGTLIYFLLGCAVLGGFYTFGKRRNFGLTSTLTILTVFCMWLLWAVTWLMQWHPLIRPIKEAPL